MTGHALAAGETDLPAADGSDEPLLAAHKYSLSPPLGLTPVELQAGYDWAYREFYRWSSIARGGLVHGARKHQAKPGRGVATNLWGSNLGLQSLFIYPSAIQFDEQSPVRVAGNLLDAENGR